MRVAFIAPFGMRPKATVPARMVPMAQALARRGHTVRIVVPPWDDPSPPSRLQTQNLTPSGAPGSVELVTLPMPRALTTLTLPGGLVKHSLWSNPKYKIDLVHVFKPIGYSGMAVTLLSALRVPWVLDVDDWDGPGGWLDVNPYTRPQKVVFGMMDALLPRMARAVTAASRTLEARTWDMGQPRSRVFYVPNGVSPDKYGGWVAAGAYGCAPLRERLNLTGGPTILLYTRLAEYPYRWPLDVLRRVISEHPDARLVVVGSGFFGEEEKLRTEAGRMGLGNHVVVTGRVPEAEVPAYLALGDVALYPMADNLITRSKSPVKVLEPMLMGMPIVAHRVGQAAEFIGDAGVLVEPGDLPGMGNAVSRLLNDSALRAELGRRARERVWSKFNWDDIIMSVEEAYTIALRGARS